MKDKFSYKCFLVVTAEELPRLLNFKGLFGWFAPKTICSFVVLLQQVDFENTSYPLCHSLFLSHFAAEFSYSFTLDLSTRASSVRFYLLSLALNVIIF